MHTSISYLQMAGLFLRFCPGMGRAVIANAKWMTVNIRTGCRLPSMDSSPG